MRLENRGNIETVGTGRDLQAQQKEIINRTMKFFIKKNKDVCIFIVIKPVDYDNGIDRN